MKNLHTRGQAMITVLFIAMIGIVVTTGALYAHVNNIRTSSLSELQIIAHSAAESGIENALIQLIRNPSYTGETMTLGVSENAVVTISGTNPITITSTGSIGAVSQKITAVVQYIQGSLVINSWSDSL